MVNISPPLFLSHSSHNLLCSHNMASISQGLVLTTAMVVSTTVLYLAFSWQKTHSPPFQIPHHPNKQILRSSLYSEEKKRERKKKNKKKVKFAENVLVMEERESDEEIKGEQRKQNSVSSRNCSDEISEIRRMPANRIALYNGILRDRVHRMASCH